MKLDGVNVMAMDYGEYAAPTTGQNARTMGPGPFSLHSPPMTS